MSHYRIINKELVDEVQRMRKEITLYHDEIIRLKRELMEQHELEGNFRKQCYNWAVNNVIQLIQTMEPDRDILSALKEHAQSQEILSSKLSSITMELRRSNSITNLRKSLRNTSPIRRSQQDNEVEEQVMSSEIEIIQSDSLPPPTIAEYNVIYEESNEENDDSVEVVDSSYEITVKDLSRESFGTNKKYPTTQANKEVSINSPNLLYSDMTFRDFINLPSSSTPKLVKDTTTESISNNISVRPSRKCKPVSLVEPNLSTKMRSEIVKPKRKTKSKPKK